ncbi:flagellar biosynthetic protein FliR [Enterococcus alcedinis]|uniref:Flagellar biosynthetic protein FliR n=1 Tax=Enterococcus alcedinis TaxID=1274384 RepID=A0A917JHT9_9ENTE|nr:flagellar biosynthetic protein FliR [Enterococcus alcedinis]MBP2102603.1 flagellar biosynthetic protein FliR [Enterococcus alcedinis]GGI66162.1 flagellar biosynthetic protein FliR [Enterococcus alcedinis]
MELVQVGIFVFIRITAFMIISPVFSQKGIPNFSKIILSAALMIVTVPLVPSFEPIDNLFVFGLVVWKEVLFGLAMGFLSQLVFTGVEIAGQLVDFQVGFSMAQAYDPTFQIMSSQYGKLYYWLTLMVIFLTNLHHYLIKGVVDSFQLVPIGAASIPGVTVEGVIKLFALTFEMALHLAAPLVISAMVIDVLLGILSRTIPQINVLMMGMPMKSGFSFIIFLLLVPNTLEYLTKIVPKSLQYMMEFIKSIS